jgi:hypothetical protein
MGVTVRDFYIRSYGMDLHREHGDKDLSQSNAEAASEVLGTLPDKSFGLCSKFHFCASPESLLLAYLRPPETEKNPLRYWKSLLLTIYRLPKTVISITI